MSRRTRRPAGRPLRRPGDHRSDASHALRRLAEVRGTRDAERALAQWESALLDEPSVFDASVAFLAEQGAQHFSDTERRYLLAYCAELADDPFYGAVTERLEARLDEIAREWGADPERESDDELREESPAYRAVSDALGAIRDALEVEFLCALGAPEVARWLVHEPERYEQLFHDGPTQLLGGPRLVLDADDDPFGVLLS